MRRCVVLLLAVAGSARAQPPSPRNVVVPVRPEIVRVGMAAQAENLTYHVDPVYPRVRVQGTVRLQAVIGKNGHVESLKLISGHPLLVPPAMEAVTQWEYRPKLWGGEPVKVLTTIEVPFIRDPAVVDPKGDFR